MKKISTYFLIIATLFIIPACIFDPQDEPENELPTCQILSPAEGQAFYNTGEQQISVSAEDTDGTITNIKLSVNQIGVASLNTFPYNYTWDVQDATFGEYMITAIATDNLDGKSYDTVFVNILREPVEFEDDRDGKTYQAVYIGNQLWMAENLAYDAGAGSYAYNDNEDNVALYGRLYKWEQAKNACPEGWHLPIKSEWDELVENVGGSEIAGGKLKLSGTAYWNSPNTGATNETGFSAIAAAGLRDTFNYFKSMGTATYFWTASEGSNWEQAYVYSMSSSHGKVSQTSSHETYAFSVRCVKDE